MWIFFVQAEYSGTSLRLTISVCCDIIIVLLQQDLKLAEGAGKIEVD